MPGFASSAEALDVLENRLIASQSAEKTSASRA